MKAQSRRPYGVGLAYRSELHREMMRYTDELDLLEIPTEDYIVRSRRLAGDSDGRLLREALERLPGVAHGISMSIGSVEPHDASRLRGTEQFLREFGLDVFSEHLAYHRMSGTDVLMFLCMPFEEVSLRWLAAKYWQVRKWLDRPIALENVSYYYPAPGCSLSEADFLTRLTTLTDCTLLLDVTNVYNNATNHGYDPIAFIRGLPGHRVSQLHLAGGHYSDGMWQDSHSAPVMPPVWDLLHETLKHTAAEMVILERDSDFYPFEGVMRDVRKAREIFYEHRPTKPADSAAGAAETLDKDDSRSSFFAADELEQLGADPEVQQLRQFQQATVAVISDPVEQRRWTEDVANVAADFDLDDRWAARWISCDRQRIELLQRKWRYIEDRQLAEQRAYERLEWSAWARKALEE